MIVQIRGMHTIIRDRETHKADFVFYADRLLRLVSSQLLRGSPAGGRRRRLQGCTFAAALRQRGRKNPTGLRGVRAPAPGLGRGGRWALLTRPLPARRWWRLGWDTCPSRSGL